MSLRSAPLEPSHVQALNMITLDFRGKRYAQVRRHWEIYLKHLSIPATDPNWNQKRGELLANLLVEMGKQLGFKFDTTHVTAEFYRPQYHNKVQQELDEIRVTFLQILRKESFLPVLLFPGKPQANALRVELEPVVKAPKP